MYRALVEYNAAMADAQLVNAEPLVPSPARTTELTAAG